MFSMRALLKKEEEGNGTCKRLRKEKNVYKVENGLKNNNLRWEHLFTAK